MPRVTGWRALGLETTLATHVYTVAATCVQRALPGQILHEVHRCALYLPWCHQHPVGGEC